MLAILFSFFPIEEPCPPVLCTLLFCVNGFEENDDGCEICKCREGRCVCTPCTFSNKTAPFKNNFITHAEVCEDTDLEEIARECGGKRCVLYNSTTQCAECVQGCGNGESSVIDYTWQSTNAKKYFNYAHSHTSSNCRVILY